MVGATDSKSSERKHAGSSPALGTTILPDRRALRNPSSRQMPSPLGEGRSAAQRREGACIAKTPVAQRV